MRIKEVHYEFCSNLGNYEHEKIRLVAEMGEEESYDEVLTDLKQKVHSQTEDESSYWKRVNEIGNLKTEQKRLEKALEEMRERYNSTVYFMETNGIKTGWQPFPESNGKALPPSTVEGELVSDYSEF